MASISRQATVEIYQRIGRYLYQCKIVLSKENEVVADSPPVVNCCLWLSKEAATIVQSKKRKKP